MSINFDGLVADAYESVVASGLRMEVRKRRSEFRDELEMQLMTIARSPEARARLDREFEEAWKSTTLPSSAGEVIIGGGVHAAVYSAVRHQTGHLKPLVVERKTPGGPFAGAPWFRMNSRNRGGSPGEPSENAALNHLPGAPIQMAMLSSAEFQTNAEQAFVVRTMLARYANVVVGNVREVATPDLDVLRVTLEDGRSVDASRVLDARGLGDPRGDADGERVMNFAHFAERMSRPFPFNGLGTVAVVGGGDGGKVVVEALLGLGPDAGMSVAGLDWVDQVDWFAQVPATCEVWREEVRGRYQALGSFLRPLDNGAKRLRVFTTSDARVQPSFEGALVDGRFYDHVVQVTGWEREGLNIAGAITRNVGDGLVLAKKVGTHEFYRVGPAADIAVQSVLESSAVLELEDNKVAMFRLAKRTAALAAQLSPATVPAVTPSPGAKRPANEDRPVLGKDRNGREIREGDRVRIDVGARLYEGTGTALRVARSGLLATRRDDGQKDTGEKDGAWMSSFSTVELLVEDTNPPSAKPETDRVPVDRKDRNGKPLFVGDRVRVYERPRQNEFTFTGTIVNNPEYSEYTIRRDDGLRQDGPDGTRLTSFPVELIEEEKPVPERKELAKDKNGTPIYEGDRVRYRGGGQDVGVAIFDPDIQVAVLRDDGEKGSGRDGAYRYGADSARYMEVLPSPEEEAKEVPEERKVIGLDQYGRSIREGDRVRATYDGITFEGVAREHVGRRNGTSRVSVLRDDGRRGSGPDGAFTIRTDSLITLIKEAIKEEREVLAQDSQGRDVRVGDRVRVNIANYTGVVTGYVKDENYFLVMRDDGEYGAYTKNVVLLTEETPVKEEREFLGNDVDGVPVSVGDRVALVKVAGATGTVVLNNDGRFGVARDDGQTGSGPNGEFMESKVRVLPVLGKDSEGRDVREGDRVRLDNGVMFVGTVVKSTIARYPYAVKCDNGARGSNGDGACVRNDGSVTLLSEEKESREVIGTLPSGEDVYEGARVDFLYGGYQPQGIAVKDVNSPVGFAIQRDDGEEGVGPNRSWRIYEDTIKNVRLI